MVTGALWFERVPHRFIVRRNRHVDLYIAPIFNDSLVEIQITDYIRATCLNHQFRTRLVVGVRFCGFSLARQYLQDCTGEPQLSLKRLIGIRDTAHVYPLSVQAATIAAKFSAKVFRCILLYADPVTPVVPVVRASGKECSVAVCAAKSTTGVWVEGIVIGFYEASGPCQNV